MLLQLINCYAFSSYNFRFDTTLIHTEKNIYFWTEQTNSIEITCPYKNVFKIGTANIKIIFFHGLNLIQPSLNDANQNTNVDVCDSFIKNTSPAAVPRLSYISKLYTRAFGVALLSIPGFSLYTSPKDITLRLQQQLRRVAGIKVENAS